MDFDALFKAQLDDLKQEGNYRIFAELERSCGALSPRGQPWRDGSAARSPSGARNDYLGMGQHPDVVQAMVDTVQACGTGAGGTRNISGTNHHHLMLEARTGRPARQGSGAAVHLGLRVELGGAVDAGQRACPNAVILSDELNHASMIEGIRHSPRRQGDLEAQRPGGSGPQAGAPSARDRPKIVAFEIVYSMDGDIAPDRGDRRGRPKRMARMTYIDEVHAVGMYGPRGGGVAEARRPDGPDHPDRGHAGQGLWRGRRLYHRIGGACAISSAPLPRASSSPPPCRPPSPRRRRRPSAT